MQKPNKKPKKKDYKKEMILSANSTNDLNELSSKSLLANVLDINDDFGVINKTSYFNKFSNNRSNPKIPNEQN